LREAVPTSAFWIMVSVLFLVTASVHARFIHLPAILADRGSTAPLAAFASSLFGVGLSIGRMGCGYLLDQFFAPRVASVLFSSVAIGIAFLEVGHDLVCVHRRPLVGLGIGAEVDIIAYLTSRYFGLCSYKAICGWIWAVFGVSWGLGAYLMGLGVDKTGSYVLPLSGFFCAAALATLLILSLGPYRYRVGLPDVPERARERGFLGGELASRSTMRPCNFFREVPSGCRAYVEHVIHDWDDERAQIILANCVGRFPQTASSYSSGRFFRKGMLHLRASLLM
jgi:hypothetical protein